MELRTYPFSEGKPKGSPTAKSLDNGRQQNATLCLEPSNKNWYSEPSCLCINSPIAVIVCQSNRLPSSTCLIWKIFIYLRDLQEFGIWLPSCQLRRPSQKHCPRHQRRQPTSYACKAKFRYSARAVKVDVLTLFEWFWIRRLCCRCQF